MSKYAGLGTYLRRQAGPDVPMTFSEIETVTGTKLPPKAQHSRTWWSNNASNNVMTKIWLDAGFESAGRHEGAQARLPARDVRREARHGGGRARVQTGRGQRREKAKSPPGLGGHEGLVHHRARIRSHQPYVYR